MEAISMLSMPGLDAASGIDRKTAVYATLLGHVSDWRGQLEASVAPNPTKIFVERMCRRSATSFELFAALIEKCGYTKYLRNHDWTSFARRYNGPGYRRYNYHTRMAKAYAHHSAFSRGCAARSLTSSIPSTPQPTEHSMNPNDRITHRLPYATKPHISVLFACPGTYAAARLPRE